MASSKLADMTATTALAVGDLAYVVRDPAGTPVDRKITIANLALALSRVVQVVNTQTGAYASGTTQIPVDDTIPQNTEGDEYMTLAITPTNVNNKLRIDVQLFALTGTASRWTTAALFQDSTANALAAATNFVAGGNTGCMLSFTHYMTAGTTSATTFKVRAGLHSTGTFGFNGSSSARLLGGVFASSITITEILV